VDLSRVDPRFLRKTYKEADWSGQDLNHFVPVGCRFEGCRFDNANLFDVCFGGGMEDSVYINCTFDRSTIRATAAGNARFTSCTFRNVDIQEFFALRVEMVDCEFSGIVRKAYFNGTVPQESAAVLKRTRNVFQGNDFSKAQLIDVAFRTGIDLTLQKLPPGWKNEA
jgi:uncharacterized protein YjbI with pentapeptide repeats